MTIDLQRFDNAYRAAFSPLNLPRLEAQHRLLSFMSGDAEISDLRWGAYMLATVKHECADQWAPIEEIGRGAGRDYGRPDPQTGHTYYGRGYVQLTHKTNYERLGAAIGTDLVNLPDRALVPDIAYQVMRRGMIDGLFTGVGLSRYLNAASNDYLGARRIINGQDQAQLIAGYARTLEDILRRST